MHEHHFFLSHAHLAFIPAIYLPVPVRTLQVEVFISEHLRPLERSAVITQEQRRAVAAKAAGKVMERHKDATSARFLIKEGERVRRLADKYVELMANHR